MKKRRRIVYYDTPSKIESISTLKELFNRYGPPSSCNEIILKKDISLHEYQGGLYKYIPKVDSLSIIENVYRKGHITTIIWYLPSNQDSIKILDDLSWNNNVVHF